MIDVLVFIVMLDRHCKVYIACSSIISLVNCETKQRTLFERIYFSQYWAKEMLLRRALQLVSGNLIRKSHCLSSTSPASVVLKSRC